MESMPSELDLKRLHWRAHHRGTKEADLMIGGFFDAHHASWGDPERAMFEAMLWRPEPTRPACGRPSSRSTRPFPRPPAEQAADPPNTRHPHPSSLEIT